MDKKTVILIDNGHGAATPGKRSPDGAVREYAWTRRAAAALAAALRAFGLDARLLVPETSDTPLAERVRRANALCAERGAGGVLLISLHCNAAGADGAWHAARGWEVYVSPAASGASRRLAAALTKRAAEDGFTRGRAVPAEGYWQKSLYILNRTRCPAVLTENLFMDNAADCARLRDPDVCARLVALHRDALLDFLGV